jgi:hypothetical protein
MENGWQLGLMDAKFSPTRAPYMGMMISEPTATKSANNDNITGAIYTADNRGNIFEVMMEDASGTPLGVLDWELRTIATLQENNGDVTKGSGSYANPYGFAITSKRGARWIAGGTADVAAKNEGGEGDFLQNKDQLFFAFTTEGQSNRLDKPYIRTRDWTKLSASSLQGDAGYSIDGSGGEKGWYVMLEKGDKVNTQDEYVSAKPVLLGGTLYVATFIARKLDTKDPEERCSSVSGISGKSRLYSVDVSTGSSDGWSGGKKFVEIDGIKITGLTKSTQGTRDRVLVTYDKLEDDNGVDAADKQEDMMTRSTTDGIDMLVVEKPRSGRLNMPDHTTLINYWITR